MSLSTTGYGALPEFEDELEGEDEYEGEEFDLGGVISGLLGEGELEDEYEDEWEGEFEDEDEAMANPLRRVYPDAMMEHLGHAAAEAETEAEAEAFVGALVPLAARLVRKAAAPHVARATPHLVRGLSKVTHDLRRKPGTRRLVQTVPTIAARTTRSLARQVARGRPITARRATQTLARQTAAVLRNPHTRRRVVRHARALDRRYHQTARTGGTWTGARGATGVAPVRYRYGMPVNGATSAAYGTSAGRPAPAGYRVPGRYGTLTRRVPGQAGSGRVIPGHIIPGQVIPGQAVSGRGYPRRRRPPAGLSVVWVPMQAWTGRQPPTGAYRY